MLIRCSECKSTLTVETDRCPWCGFDPWSGFDPFRESQLEEEEYEDDE